MRNRIKGICKNCGGPRDYRRTICRRCFAPPLEERFKKNTITSGECMIWTGGKNKLGYGHINYLGKVWRVHRLAYEHFKGKIGDGLFVCHSCDVPLCINPKHLWLGTNADNMRDGAMKGRINRGENHPDAILSWNNVYAIRRRYSKGFITQKKLAEEYGVNSRTVNSLIRGHSWRPLPC